MLQSIKYGFDWLNSESSYSLVHFNPPRNTEDRYLYSDANVVCTFASDYVFRQLSSQHRMVLLTESAALFNAESDITCSRFGSASAGNLFEKLCLWLAPIADHTINCESMQDSERDSFTVAIPDSEILAHDWKEKRDLTSSEVLYQPVVSNMESGSAFCVLLIDNKYVLMVSQMTVAENHPINANGLTQIYYAFSETIRQQITRKIIIFVTPVGGKLYTTQPIRTTSTIKNCHSAAENFEQWVCRHRVTM